MKSFFKSENFNLEEFEKILGSSLKSIVDSLNSKILDEKKKK